jgi:hypothetical protein
MATSASLPRDTALSTCVRCGMPYDWRKSSSWTLKMTYCSSLCERGGLGFTLETFFRGTQIERLAWRDIPVADPTLGSPDTPIHLLLA